MAVMGAFPRLVRYKENSTYSGIVLLMTEPHRGVALFIPTNQTESHLGEGFNPANYEIEDYSGSVLLKNGQDPSLGD